VIKKAKAKYSSKTPKDTSTPQPEPPNGPVESDTHEPACQYASSPPVDRRRQQNGIDHFRAPLSEGPAMQCRHCKQRKALAGHRQLCQVCFTNKAIRDQHAKQGLRGDGDRNIVNPPLSEPTRALPGSEAKIRVLTDRARNWRRLWHPRDGKANAD
jgi:hypothetical protein